MLAPVAWSAIGDHRLARDQCRDLPEAHDRLAGGEQVQVVGEHRDEAAGAQGRGGEDQEARLAQPVDPAAEGDRAQDGQDREGGLDQPDLQRPGSQPEGAVGDHRTCRVHRRHGDAGDQKLKDEPANPVALVPPDGPVHGTSTEHEGILLHAAAGPGHVGRPARKGWR